MDSLPSTHYVSFLSGEQQHPARRRTWWLRFVKNSRARARLVALIALVSVVCFSTIFIWLHMSEEKDLLVDEDDVMGPFRPAVRPSEIWAWSEEDFQQEFAKFKKKHNKLYSYEEHKMRYGIFKKNLYYIHTHNSQGHSYTLKMNKFGDLTIEEFRLRYTTLKVNDHKHVPTQVNMTAAKVDEKPLPEKVDWRAEGCVTDVKDQKQCGSCWAFSATGAIEGALCKKSGNLTSLSEQQLVDCSRGDGNEGCQGGLMDQAFKYVISNGLCSEETYPYEGKENDCKAKSCNPIVNITAFVDIPPSNDTALQSALAETGPASVAIDADEMGFQFYDKGVFDGQCGDTLNHGVLAVGYGTDAESGKEFWIVKNSWGPKWGEDGYVRLVRGKHGPPEGQCGILKAASYPVI